MRILVAALMFSLTLSAPVSLGQSKCSSLPSGALSGRTYTNDGLGLSYTFPNGLTATALASLPKDKNSRLLLVLWKTPRDFEKPSVTIFVDDPSAYPDHTALGYLHRIENTAKRYTPPAKTLAFGREYDMSGVKFYRLDYQFPDPSPIYDSALTGQVAGCEITFQFVATAQTQLDALADSIKTVGFSTPKP